MTSSPGTRRKAACLSLALVAWLPASCAAPQPEACAAYLACFFPEGEASAYVDAPDAGCPENPDAPDAVWPEGAGALCQAQLGAKREEAYALYGPTGECWRSGEGDPLYATCVKACRAAIVEECRIAKDGQPRAAYCIAGEGDARRFEPPADPSLSRTCVEVEGS